MGLGDMLQAQQDAEDARRYRFIRNPAHCGKDFNDMWTVIFDFAASGKQMDDAIDAAMKRVSASGDSK